jgi:hypothetical protein
MAPLNVYLKFILLLNIFAKDVDDKISPVKLFADHLRTALWTYPVNTALAGHVRFFMPALRVGANTAATRARSGFVTATSTPLTLTLAASATKDSDIH